MSRRADPIVMNHRDTARALRRLRVVFVVLSIGEIAAGIAIALLVPSTLATVVAVGLVSGNLAFNGVYLHSITKTVRARHGTGTVRSD